MTTSTHNPTPQALASARHATYAHLTIAANTANRESSAAHTDPTSGSGAPNARRLTPAQQRRNRNRTIRGLVLLAMAVLFDSVTQVVELTFSASRPVAVIAVTAIMSAVLVTVDQWLLPALIRRRERNTIPPCAAYTQSLLERAR